MQALVGLLQPLLQHLDLPAGPRPLVHQRLELLRGALPVTVDIVVAAEAAGGGDATRARWLDAVEEVVVAGGGVAARAHRRRRFVGTS